MSEDKNTQNINIWSKPKRIKDLKELGETIGLWNISITEMAKKYEVTRKTVYSDIEALFKKGIDKDSVDKAVVNIDNLNKQLLKGLQAEFVKAKNPRDKSTVAHALLSVQEKITEFLERYGYKEKVADKHEIAGQSINLILNGKVSEYPRVEVPPGESKTG